MTKMWIFSRFSYVKKRIDDQEKRILELERTVIGLVTENETLRNKILRKIQKPQQKEAPEEMKKGGIISPEQLKAYQEV
jgi:regulator of replication initiation timing